MTERSLSPLAAGDLLVTATRLAADARYPTGNGAVRQLGADLRPKAEALTGSTGLVAGLGRLPDGSVLALDPQARTVARFHPDGRRAPDPDLGGHPFGAMLVTPEGDVLLAEHLCAPSGPFAGEGRVHRFTADLRPVRRYATLFHGGVSGFLGVTHMVLSVDGTTLFHLSETGPHVYAHDLKADRALGPVFTAREPPAMLFGLCRLPEGDLLVATGRGLLRLNGGQAGFEPAGHIPLPPARPGERAGWANVIVRPRHPTVWALDFHGGRLAEVDPEGGNVRRLVDLGLPSALASLLEVP
ncbi:MAG: hypothetical protein NZM40_09020 [Sphingomonadaceae bacterium]|uniref:hypothetical protein n=1 Tax=Thermaurantiacus sp. TaxID=2820283 RepID=UPI00298F3A4F|nr:hypothetical protein [Thermaurantiacus sp.]MCS6987548.1 hypothetical protein [Sphingomonadaceae bacterium]MDW8415149.1 hypothetical protein [Thermaurantiacus sp.]